MRNNAIRATILALTLTLALVGARTSVGDQTVHHYRGGLAHTGYFPTEKLSPRPEVVKKYGLVNVGIHTASKSSATVEAGIIYVGADSGFLYAIREQDMTVKWSFRVRPTSENGIHGTPAVDARLVYIGAYDGWLYALDKSTGRLVWQSKVGDYIGASPVLWGDRLFVGVETKKPDGYLTCVSKETGKELFRSQPFGDHTHCTPTINTETRTAFLGSNSKKFFAIDTDDGRIKWNYTTGGQIKSTAALHDGDVLFTSWDGHLYRLTQDTGQVVWRFKSLNKSMSSPTVDAESGRVYFGSHDYRLYCVDLVTGKGLWFFKTGKRIISSPTIVRNAESNGKIVVFGSADNIIYGLDAAGQGELFRIRTQGKVSCVPTIKNGTLYMNGDDGWLYVIR